MLLPAIFWHTMSYAVSTMLAKRSGHEEIIGKTTC